jgi:ABC-type multidrug transport system fused ATPase/permease subunit
VAGRAVGRVFAATLRGTAQVRHAATAASAVVGGGRGGVLALRDALFGRLARLLGGEKYIWPPSAKSFPLLGSFWAMLACCIWYCVRERKNKAVAEIAEIRREYALGSLENLLANERVREQELQWKVEKLLELGIDPKRAAVMTRKEVCACSLASMRRHGILLHARSIQEGEVKGGETGEQGLPFSCVLSAGRCGRSRRSVRRLRRRRGRRRARQRERQRRRQRRTSRRSRSRRSRSSRRRRTNRPRRRMRQLPKRRMTRLSRRRRSFLTCFSTRSSTHRSQRLEWCARPLSDPVTIQPCPRAAVVPSDFADVLPAQPTPQEVDDPRFAQGMALLRRRVKEEMREAIDKTRMAREEYSAMLPLQEAVNVPRDLHHFADGEKLMKRARFARYRVRKCLKGKHREFDRKSIAEIDALVKESMQRWKLIGDEQRSAAKKIWSLLAPHKMMYLFGMVLRMVTQVSWGFWYGRIVSLPGRIIENSADPRADAARHCILQFVWFLFNWPMDKIANTCIQNTQSFFTLGLRDAVMGSILRQDREYFDFHHAGVLQERLNHDTGMLAHHVIRQPADFMAMLSHVVSKTVYMYLLSPQLFWVSISIPIPLTLVLCWASIEFLRKLHRKIRRVHEAAAAGSIDVLREITTVRQFAMEEKEHSRYSVSNLFRRILERRLQTADRFTWGIIGVGFWGTQILITWVGLRMILGAGAGPRPMTASQLTVICVNMHDIVWATRYIIDLVPELMKLEEPIQRVAATLGTMPRIEPHPDKDTSHLLKPERFLGHLVFEDVHFTYPTEKQKPVLKGFSFEVKPGQKVACVGRAGCGKSTSIGLLQRLYEPDAGRILLDGKPIQDYDVHYLRRCTGIVAQDNVLFATSIKENIIYGMGQGHLPTPTDEEIWDVCEKANAREFIESFPNRLNTRVGERGVKLSGGQKQRIAIARAMIRKPTILLLDEATSALDPVNEKVVQRALDQLMEEHAGVAIVIAHRLTTIKNCDNIVMMHKGQKVEEGTHAELMAIQVKKDVDGDPIQGYFHNQWDTQMGEESFGSPDHMTDEQLEQKRLWWAKQIEEVEKEATLREDPPEAEKGTQEAESTDRSSETDQTATHAAGQ